MTKNDIENAIKAVDDLKKTNIKLHKQNKILLAQNKVLLKDNQHYEWMFSTALRGVLWVVGTVITAIIFSYFN